MDELYLMMTICDRNFNRRLLSFYREYGVTVVMVTMGRGTATNEVLDSFGLEAAEKAAQFAVVTGREWKKIKSGLEKDIKIDIPGTGVAFTVPISSVGGRRQIEYLTEGRGFEKGDESVLKGTKYELLVVIANKGYSEDIMDAARRAAASGGTVLHAKGTGAKKAEQFLGVSLADEKEMIFLVTKSERKNAIMQAVMDKQGLKSKARSIVFSLPVTETAGMRLAEDEEE